MSVPTEVVRHRPERERPAVSRRPFCISVLISDVFGHRFAGGALFFLALPLVVLDR